MNTRWCVTAVFAVGALGCSDPVPPPSQGAFTVSVTPPSPGIPGKSCPTGAAHTYEVPLVVDQLRKLGGGVYKEFVIDGERGAKVSCTVKGKSTFSVAGKISTGLESVEVAGGVFGPDFKGTAQMIFNDLQDARLQVASQPSACTFEVVTTEDGPQLKPGSVWASFSCPVTESPPGIACATKGFIVLENCRED